MAQWVVSLTLWLLGLPLVMHFWDRRRGVPSAASVEGHLPAAVEGQQDRHGRVADSWAKSAGGK